MAHANSELLVLKFLRFVLVCVCVCVGDRISEHVL